MVDVVLGLQWGDEAKGKVTDFLTPNYEIVTHPFGGPNGGHSLEINGQKRVLSSIPCGIFGESMCLIGASAVINPTSLKSEIIERVAPFQSRWPERIILSEETAIILPVHKLLDVFFDDILKIGTTKKGIGQLIGEKAFRLALRVRDIKKPDFKDKVERSTNIWKRFLGSDVSVDNSQFFEDSKWIADNIQIVSCPVFMHDALRKKQSILAAGTQGTLLDLDLGTYPYVTASRCTTGGVLSGLGIGPKFINRVIGVYKAYGTRVGGGPLPGELTNEIGEKIGEVGKEFGSVTGRKRRPAYLDLVALEYACMVNSVTELVQAKGDVFDDPFFRTVCTYESYVLNGKTINHFLNDADVLSMVEVNSKSFPAWEGLGNARRKNEMPENYIKFLKHIESKMGLKHSLISVSPDREGIIAVN